MDLNPEREAMARQFGMAGFVNPNEVENVVDHIIQLTDGGADYSFECIGNTKVMRQTLECCHRGWGQAIIIGVAEAGAEIATRPFQLVTGREWKGSAFGGARGRTDVPKIVDWYMDGKINIDDLITHTKGLKAMIKRRSAIEPTIGHMKSEGKLDRNWLKDTLGDALHAILCGAGHNIRLLLSRLRLFYVRPAWAHCEP